MMSRFEQSELYGKYAPVLFGRCRRFLRTTDEAQEATGEIFRRFLDQWERLRDGGCAMAWIHQATVNRCLATLRLEKEWLGAGSPSITADERFEEVTPEGREVIEALLHRSAYPWDALTREIAMYAHWDGYSQEEIASLTGLAAESVRNHLDVARRWAGSRLAALA